VSVINIPTRTTGIGKMSLSHAVVSSHSRILKNSGAALSSRFT